MLVEQLSQLFNGVTQSRLNLKTSTKLHHTII